MRPGRLELARLDDLLGDCTDNIVVAKMDVEAGALECFSLVMEAGVRLRALSLLRCHSVGHDRMCTPASA